MKMLDVQVVAPAVGEVVSVQEFVDHGRLNNLTVGMQPDLIQRQIDAATQRCEMYLRRSLLKQTLKALFVPDGKNCACARTMHLPRGPVEAVTNITSDGQDITGFTVAWSTVMLNAPLTAPAEVLYISAGFGDAGVDVPEPVREGILEYATQLYEDRTGAREPKYAAAASGGTIPRGVQDLWRPFQLEMSG